MLDIAFRSVSRAAWDRAAEAWGIQKTDPDTGDVTVAPGYDIDHIGFAVLDPGTPGANPGDPPLVPPTYDTWWRTNLRLTGGAYEEDRGDLYPGDTHDGYGFRYSKLVGHIRDTGRPVTVGKMRGVEHGTGNQAVQVLDPSDPAAPAPQRVWFGGQSY